LNRSKAVLQYHLADDVVLEIRADAAPGRQRASLKALGQAAWGLENQKGGNNDDHG